MARIGAAAAGLLLAFTALALLLAAGTGRSPVHGWDAVLTGAVADTRSPFATGAALLLHHVGAWPWGSVLVVGLLLPLVLLRRWISALLVALAWAATSLAAVPLAKDVVGRGRPAQGLVVEDSAAYPSGHTAFAAALAVAAAAVSPPRARIPVLLAGAAFTAVMAWSRMYLGVHWFFDTVGGALLGAGLGLLVWWLLHPLLPRPVTGGERRD